MKQEQGFLIKKNERIFVNKKKTTSILTNQLQVDLLRVYSDYFKGKLLDVGCGEKPYSLIYNNYVESSIGVDVETCVHEQRYVDVFASADDLPFEDSTFDTVLCTNVLEHVANMEAAFQEISRVHKSGGTLIISVPFLYPTHEAPYDYYRFTGYGLEYLLDKYNYEILECKTWGGPGLFFATYFSMIFGKLIHVKLLNSLCCEMQKIFYYIYKKMMWKRLINKDEHSISKIISLGNFVIAKKK